MNTSTSSPASAQQFSIASSPTLLPSSPLAMVPSPPLETPEEAISLLRLLRADHNVSLAEFSLLDCEINRCAARLQYYTHQAEKARKQIQHAEHAIGYGRKVITRSGYLTKSAVALLSPKISMLDI
ncbi:hypothetical protein EDD15DRAFT_2359335 [Pisolithus albus]|nr:hypothetical protein EDD15DRAFT_2359335 [Pisolithus albus]